MAEQQTSQERTEQPTERRKKEAREKGQVPRSKELNTMLSLLVGGFGLVALGGYMASDFTDLFKAALTIDRDLAFDKAVLAPRLVGVIVSALGILAPLFAVLIAGVLVGPLLIGGWSFSLDTMAFKLEKLSPLKGLGRIVSAKALLELVKAVIKFGVLSVTAIIFFSLMLDQIIALGSLPAAQAFGHAVVILQWGLLAVSFAMILIVVFDVPFELWNFNRQQMMTRQEVRDEMKDSEGRPEVKSRILALQREMAQRRMMEAVPTADVVITNPTHFAVALKYDAVSGKAPVLVAKGRDLIALQIRSVAEEHEVAIFSAPPLARALYASSDIGDEIPQDLYLAVAKVLAYIFQLRSGGGGAPAVMPDDIAVPEEYRDLYAQDGRNGDE